MAERENAISKVREQANQIKELEKQVKDSQFYTSAIEKENQFLRLEVERVKYSKDKEGYNKFLSGLLKIGSAKN